MGDFNSVLYKEDRIGGNEVTKHEIQELTSFMEDCDVSEMCITRAYFSLTNKTIWSRIDRVFINGLWCEVFDYTTVKYLTNGLSDHTPMLIQFPTAPKPSPQFQYCDMWSSHSNFHSVITSMHPTVSSTHNMKNLCKYLA